MKTRDLIKEMDKYARALIQQHLSDFTDHDIKVIRQTKAETPFVWIVGKSGTRLFLCDNEDKIRSLINLLGTGIERTELAYIYDGVYFRPESFENLNEWVAERLQQML